MRYECFKSIAAMASHVSMDRCEDVPMWRYLVLLLAQVPVINISFNLIVWGFLRKVTIQKFSISKLSHFCDKKWKKMLNLCIKKKKMFSATIVGELEPFQRRRVDRNCQEDLCSFPWSCDSEDCYPHDLRMFFSTVLHDPLTCYSARTFIP